MKPKDFSESAVNLCNPPEVRQLLDSLSDEQGRLDFFESELKKNNADLIKKISAQSERVAEVQTAIREAIKAHGSYQDLKGERYGVQYERKTPIYSLEPFKKNFPKFVELCVKETIDINALKGQVKGKLITEEELEKAGVLLYELSTAFYIR